MAPLAAGASGAEHRPAQHARHRADRVGPAHQRGLRARRTSPGGGRGRGPVGSGRRAGAARRRGGVRPDRPERLAGPDRRHPDADRPVREGVRARARRPLRRGRADRAAPLLLRPRRRRRPGGPAGVGALGAGTVLALRRVVRARRGRRRPDRRRRSTADVAEHGGHLRHVLPLPPRRAADHRGPRAPGTPGRRTGHGAARGWGGAAGLPPGRGSRATRPPSGRALRRRQPRAADARRGRGRHRAPQHLVQPDGGEPAEPDPAAAGSLAPAAALRLGRLPRAPHAAHDRPDGRTDAVRRPRGLRPQDGTGRRAVAHRAGSLRASAVGPAGPEPLRRRRRPAGALRGRPRRHRPSLPV